METPSPNQPELIETPEVTILRLQEKIRQQDLQIAELTRQRDEALEQKAKAIELSGTDPLTELPNRREGEQRANSLLSQAARGNIDLAYVRLDIDHFKLLNDLEGHDWGDQTLQNLANALKSVLRETDNAFRYGGEEFDLCLVLTPGTSPEEINKIVERYVQEIHKIYRHKLKLGEPQDPTPLTASFGVAIINQGEWFTLKEAQKVADDNLYVSKKGGRDRITASYVHDLYARKNDIPLVSDLA